MEKASGAFIIIPQAHQNSPCTPSCGNRAAAGSTSATAPEGNQHSPLAAAPIEDLVAQQIMGVLSAPHIVLSVWDRMQQVRPGLTESQVVLLMRKCWDSQSRV